MLRIAICDDEEKQLHETAALVNSYLQSRPHLHGQTELFRSGGELLVRAESSEGFDLYVLDILMPELSGIDTGRRLRALGDGGEIIYLTSSNDFAADSYDVRAFFYLLKPVEETRLETVLSSARKALAQSEEDYLCIRNAEGIYRIRRNEILYCYSDRRKVSVVLQGREIQFYDKLDAMAQRLGDGFVRIHQRYLVRAGAVDYIGTYTVRIQDHSLPISRSMRQTAARKLAKAMLEGEAK